MGRIVRFVLFACVLTLAAILLLTWAGYSAARREPEFYRRALQVEPAKQAEWGDQLEHTALELHNDTRRAGLWSAVFTEDQVNGWLATDLPEKFPRLLPPEVREPRIAIQEDGARVACRYDNGQITTVISFVLQASLTDQPNTLAIRISKLRAGALPVPLRQFLDPITQAAQDSQIALRWGQSDGDPVALVTIPARDPEYGNREIRLKSVETRERELRIAGETVDSGG